MPQVNSKKVDLIVHGKMTFLFTTEYVKIKTPAPNLMLMVFVNDIHSRPPCLNTNLEETLLMEVKHTFFDLTKEYRAQVLQPIPMMFCLTR